MTTYVLNIAFISDWHIGAGTAKHAAVDRLVRRDADGLPFVPGRTVRGNLRDACEAAARALDDGRAGEFVALAAYLFGGPGSAGVVEVTSARLSGPVREVIGGDVALTDAVTFLRAATAIEPNGHARQDSLRTEERARGRAVLRATVELAAPAAWLDTHGWAVDLLLRAGSSLITRIGGKRRRGAGRCTFDLAGGAQEVASSQVAQFEFARPKLPAAHPADCAARQEWRRYLLTVTTREPVLVAGRARGNVVVGQAHLPGSVLLAHLSSRLGEPVVSAVADGSLVMTDGTPCGASGDRGLPAPRSLHEPRGPVPGPGGTAIARDILSDAPADGVQRRAVAGFVLGSVEAGEVQRLVDLPATVATTHVGVSTASGPFTVVAIGPGAVFRAEIWSRVPLRVGDLEGPGRIGASRRTEYGLVHMSCSEASQPPPREQVEAGSVLTVWLTSDMLLALEAPTAAGVRRVLESALATRLTLVGCAMSSSRRDRWHSGWGLPSPSLAVVDAGSVIRFEVAEPIGAEVLDRVEREGLGVRTAEGFGRVSFNPSLLDGDTELTLTSRAALAAPVDDGVGAPPADEDAAFVSAVRRAAAWRALEEEALRFVGDRSRRQLLVPALGSPSAMGDLRRALESMTTPSGHQAALAWVTQVSSSALRSEAWARWDLETLRSWFERPATFIEADAPGREAATRVAALLGLDRPEDLDGDWRNTIVQRHLLLAIAAAEAARLLESEVSV